MFKALLIAILVGQIGFLPTALGQTKSTGQKTQTVKQAPQQAAPKVEDISWMGDNQSITTPGGTTIPAASSVVFGQVSNDPFGTSNDPNNPFGSGGLGGSINGNWEPDLGGQDLNGGLGGFGSSVNNTDDIVSYFLKGSEVLNNNYAADIAALREKYSYLNDFELAKKIIADAALSAGTSGAKAVGLGVVIQFINSKMAQSNALGSWTPGVSAAVTGATFLGQEIYDFQAVTKIQAQMILRLAALFGEMPATQNEKLLLIYDSYIFPSATAGITTFVNTAIQNRMGSKVAQELGQKAVEQAVVNEVGQAAATKLLSKAGLKTLLASWVANNEARKFLGGMLGGAAAAGVSFVTNKVITNYLGNKLYAKFYAEQQSRKTFAISYVRSLPRARGTLWLLLTRDVFKRIPNPVDQKKYAQVVASEIPLLKTSHFNEAQQLLEDFNSDPTVIEKNLAQLNREMNPEAKLYFMKLIMAGMFMKGSLTAADEKTLDDVANLLGLQPPSSVRLHPQDIRRDTVTRYYGLKTEMATQVTNTLKILEKIEKGEKLSDPQLLDKAKNVQMWGPGGNIILEDFEDVTHDALILQDELINKEKSGKDTSAIKQELVKKQSEAVIKGLKKEAQKPAAK